jgi:hypothetical protein
VKEYGSTTPGVKGKPGRYAEYPQITAFDLDRPLLDVATEAAKACGWTADRVIETWNFGIRNTRQGDFARMNELSFTKSKERLQAEVCTLSRAGHGDEAMRLARLLGDCTTKQNYIDLATELWPPEEHPADFERYIGAEAEAEGLGTEAQEILDRAK